MESARTTHQIDQQTNRFLRNINPSAPGAIGAILVRSPFTNESVRHNQKSISKTIHVKETNQEAISKRRKLTSRSLAILVSERERECTWVMWTQADNPSSVQGIVLSHTTRDLIYLLYLRLTGSSDREKCFTTHWSLYL